MAESVSCDEDSTCTITKKCKIELILFPNQPMNIIFPVDPISKRRFLLTWYTSFTWLDWDENVNAVFCHPCRQLFLSDSSKYNKSEDVYTVTGFTNLKKAVEKYKQHESCHSDIFNLQKFQNMISGANIAAKLNDDYEIQRKVANECLERIFTTIRYLARQGLPLRGHIDSESNFMQLSELRTNDSKDLQIWLKRKTSWTS